MRPRRHALVIGIDDYPGFGPECQLRGGVRDARIMAEVLATHHDFSPGDVRRQLGEEATRSAILAALDGLRRRVRPGDEVLFYFSGHGSQITDREGDEGDGLDETMVPCDSGRQPAANRDISDDEIHHWAAGVLGVTPRLTLIFDCCHAATLQRPGWRVRAVPPDLRPIAALPPSPVKVWRDIEVGPQPLVLAACDTDEVAEELPPSIAGRDRGAFSYYLTAALRDGAPADSWRTIFGRVRVAMRCHCHDQHPQLSGDGIDEPPFRGSRVPVRGSDRVRRLLAWAAKPDPFALDLTVYRSRGGAWRMEDAAFAVGDRLRVDVRHHHRRELYIYLFDLGPSGRVNLLFPDLGGQERLDPEITLTIGARRGDPLELTWPTDLTADASEGTAHLLLLASETALSTAELLAGVPPPPAAHGLAWSYRFYRV